MSATREQVMQALLARISGSPLFQQAIRTVKLSSDEAITNAANQPALVQWEHDEIVRDTSPGTPPKREWTVYWLIYAQTGPDTPWATVINPLLEAVEAALAPLPIEGPANTLGGLCYWCRISGTIAKETGDTAQANSYQGCAVVPIKILMP